MQDCPLSFLMLKIVDATWLFRDSSCTLAVQVKRTFFLETRGASLGGRARHRRGLESSACSASDNAGCRGCLARAKEGLLTCRRFRRRAGGVDQKADLADPMNPLDTRSGPSSFFSP